VALDAVANLEFGYVEAAALAQPAISDNMVYKQTIKYC
jgi:hypothetical protein